MNKQKISFSQFRTQKSCAKQWEIRYVQGIKPDTSSIELEFGTAIHEVIQQWLENQYYVDSESAKSTDLNSIFKHKLISLFKEKIREVEGEKVYLCDKETLMEYYEDGVQILDHLKLHAEEFFPKGTSLIGCEIELNRPITDNISFTGYIDLVLYNKLTNTYDIIDFKTSKKGWSEYDKKNPMKNYQIVLYKKYFAEEFNVPIDNISVRFIILKRKVMDSKYFDIKRVVNFSPPSGTRTQNKAVKELEIFIEESFNPDGSYKSGQKASPGEWTCKFCPFSDPNLGLCEDSWFLQEKKHRDIAKLFLEKKSG